MSELGVAPEAVPQMPGNDAGPAGPEIPDLNGLLPHMEGNLQKQAVIYEKLKEGLGKAKTMREQLDELVKLGDMVDTEDLVGAASKLVGHGFAAAEIAGVLSEAPEGGEALKGWILQKDMLLRQNEAKLADMAALTRHDMGVAAFRLLGAHSMAQHHGFGGEPQTALSQEPSGAESAAGSANDLMSGGSPGSLPASGPSEENALGASANG